MFQCAYGGIYIPPRYQLDNREFNDLLDQLPSPFILLGDLNAHITWGNQTPIVRTINWRN